MIQIFLRQKKKKLYKSATKTAEIEKLDRSNP